jgi:DUF2946 family protein
MQPVILGGSRKQIRRFDLVIAKSGEPDLD